MSDLAEEAVYAALLYINQRTPRPLAARAFMDALRQDGYEVRPIAPTPPDAPEDRGDEASLAYSALGEAIRYAAMLRIEGVVIQAPLARYLQGVLIAHDMPAPTPPDAPYPVNAEYRDFITKVYLTPPDALDWDGLPAIDMDPRPAPDRWDSCCGLLEGHDGDHMPSRILAIRAVPTPPDAPCIFPGCVSTDRHSHGGFPGGYTNPADPTGPPIPFTSEPEPGVRDYNGALLTPTPPDALIIRSAQTGRVISPRPHNHTYDGYHWGDCPGCDDMGKTPQHNVPTPPDALREAVLANPGVVFPNLPTQPTLPDVLDAVAFWMDAKDDEAALRDQRPKDRGVQKYLRERADALRAALEAR